MHHILRVIFLCAVCIFSFPVSAQIITIPNTDVTFVPPSGFKPIPEAIKKVKWPMNTAPRFAVGNESASTTVAYDIKNQKATQEDLSLIKETLVKVFDRVIPQIQWKHNTIITHAGQKWIFLELTSAAVDTDVHNILLMTNYKDRIIVMTFNSTRQEYPRYKDALYQSIGSIKIDGK